MTRLPRKKTARACNHCHRAHMTCDEARPCKRCVAKGLGGSCVDAPRKRKKYLMDMELANSTAMNNTAMSQASSTSTSTASAHTPCIVEPVPVHSHGQGRDDHAPAQHITHSSTSSSHNKFLSHAADSEYAILSDIIRQDELLDMQQYRARSTTPTSIGHDIYAALRQGDRLINQYMLGTVQDQLLTYPEVVQHLEGERLGREGEHEHENGQHNDSETKTKGALSFSIAVDEQSEYSSLSPFGLRFKDSEDIYSRISQPFSYTPGFHSLIQYLKQRFNRQDLLKMAKAMASYRPSFIACTNTLKEDDLIFMEQCFQRTLLEYDKFIQLSGTPTIVWRRTGQIAYVSEEFCILTGWTKEMLLTKVTFIVELMDDPSVVEYFNLFSTIAYGDFRGATMGGCTLLTQYHTAIKTTCMWTLKRDVFGIPMMIIGNFLPILE